MSHCHRKWLTMSILDPERPPCAAWGKADLVSQSFHHLAHHSADVAAVFGALLEQPVFRSRAEGALGRKLADPEIACLAALVFLHDIGKLAPGFQAKGWPAGHGLRLRGHLEERGPATATGGAHG